MRWKRGIIGPRWKEKSGILQTSRLGGGRNGLSRCVTFILLSLLFGLIFSGTAFAAPFLVCDPQPKYDGAGSGVQEYIVVLDGVPYTSTPEDLGDGTVRLRFDLATVGVGSHVTEIKAVNVWGESAPVPFGFTKDLPPSPTNIGLEP